MVLPSLLSAQTATEYFDKAFQEYKDKDYDAAIQDYTSCIALDKSNFEAYYNRALAYYFTEKYTLGIADINIVLNDSPSDAEAWYWKGKMLEKQDIDLQAALECLSNAISNKSDYSDAYFERGFCRYKLKMYSLAISDYNVVLSYDPKDENALYNRGLANTKEGNDEVAIVDYMAAISIDN